jgi:hypothetical protein
MDMKLVPEVVPRDRPEKMGFGSSFDHVLELENCMELLPMEVGS